MDKLDELHEIISSMAKTIDAFDISVLGSEEGDALHERAMEEIARVKSLFEDWRTQDILTICIAIFTVVEQREGGEEHLAAFVEALVKYHLGIDDPGLPGPVANHPN